MDEKLTTSFTIFFGKKDPDLCDWVSSVPKGVFSYLVKESIKYHLNGNDNYVLPRFESSNYKDTIIKSFSIIVNTPEDLGIYKYIENIDEKMRSYEIKSILRKYLSPTNIKNNTIMDRVEEVKEIKETIVNTDSYEDINNKSSENTKVSNKKLDNFVNASRARSRA